MKINEIEILGFKGIPELIIHPKRINIIVGKNNTGKTSVLEAIYATFGNLFEMQIKYDPHISSLININAKESKILVKLDHEVKFLVLTKPEIKELIPEFKMDLLNRIKTNLPLSKNKTLLDKIEEIIDKILTKENLLYEIERESIKISVPRKTFNLFSYSPQILKELEPLIEYIDKEVIRGDFGHRLISNMLADISFSRFFRDEKVEKCVNYINELLTDETFGMPPSKSKIQEIQDYLKTRNLLVNLKRFDFDKILFKEKDKEYEIPYSFMGDGFKALIGLISQIEEENKIILLEEPENHMHPAYTIELIKQIIDFSRTRDLQFFITTHSSDVLDIVSTDRLEPSYQEYLDDELNIVRMNSFDRGIVVQELTRKEAKDELEELQLDLRGR